MVASSCLSALRTRRDRWVSYGVCNELKAAKHGGCFAPIADIAILLFGDLRPVPFNNRHAIFHVKQLGRPRFQPMLCKHILWRSRRHLGKDRSTAGQMYAGRARQKEDVITIQKYSEHLRSTDNANAVIRRPQHCQGLLQRSARRIPKKRSIITWVICYRQNSTSQNQSSPQVRMSLLFLRMPPVNDDVDTIEPSFEEGFISLEFEGGRHNSCRIGKHAILGDNRVSFDATRNLHNGQSRLLIGH